MLGINSASNKGGPYVQEYLVVNDASEIDTNIQIPTGAEILANFDQYIFGDPTVPINANFILDGSGNITNTENANPFNIKLAPSDYLAVYQAIRLSSTDSDDDYVGWVIGYKVDATNKHFLVGYLDLSAVPVARFYIRHYAIPLAAVPSTSVSYPIDINRLIARRDFTGYATSNSLGLSGYTQSPWPAGIYCESSFTGNFIHVRLNIPGAGSNTPAMHTIDIDIGQDPLLVGFKPNAGVLTGSQINSYWKQYIVSDAGKDALNLDTQTIWSPIPGTVPPQYEDTGTPIYKVILPGRYARSSKNNRWMKVDPYSKVASLSTAAPF